MRRSATILMLTAFAVTLLAAGAANSASAADNVIIQVRERGLNESAWPVEALWDEAAEEEFAEWVERLGEARERKSRRFHRLLQDPAANSLWSPEDAGIKWKTDCATLAYALRGYFAYKTGRPYSFQGYTWKRYSKGNHPRLIKDWSQYSHPWRAIRASMTAANSGSFRMRPELEGTDTYPVEVTPYCIRPGVTYYEPNGHVLVVYKVDRETGEIRLMDAHPDGTLTLKTFGSKLVRGSARFGGGFRGWRHYHVEVLDATGAFRIVRERNAEIPCHNGLEPYKSRYLVDGEQVPFHEFVQSRMRGAGVMVDPLEEFPLRLEAFCEDMQARMDAVEATTAAGVAGEAHPRSLPRNIYRAKGAWGRHGTANLDAQLRFEAIELRRMVLETLRWSASGRERLSYDGGPRQLLEDYRAIWEIYKADPACRFAYTNSGGRRVSLDLTAIFARIWDLSFDPYHCPELRWGAGLDGKDGTPSAELASCPDGKVKRAWYQKERRLRYRHIAKRTGTIKLRHGPSQPSGPADLGVFLEGVLPGADLQAIMDALRALPARLFSMLS